MKQVSILLTKQYKLLSIAAILEVFDTVNKHYSDNGQPLPFALSLLCRHQDHQDNVFDYPLKFICSDFVPGLILIPAFTTNDIGQALRENEFYIPWLQHQFKGGAEIGTFCTGVFLLAATGLLNGKIATTHVDAAKAFTAAFPSVCLKADKTVARDGRLYTSGGATSTFHLLLHLIQRFCGKDVAVWAAKKFAIDMDRDNQSYFSTFQPTKDHNDSLVATAQQKIESNYHDTGTIEEMIKGIPSSRRNMVRRFKQVTGITPIKYLQHTRIEAAKKLLEQTSHQMNEIIFKAGYNDPKAFRKIFRKAVGMTPTEYRGKFQVN